MSYRSIKKLVRLREKVEQQSKAELAAASAKVDGAYVALDQLRRHSTGAIEGKPLDLAVVDLAHTAALSTAFAIEELQQLRQQKQIDYFRKLFDKRQAERLLARVKERRDREQRRQEQKALDDWTSANWGRRKR